MRYLGGDGVDLDQDFTRSRDKEGKRRESKLGEAALL